MAKIDTKRHCEFDLRGYSVFVRLQQCACDYSLYSLTIAAPGTIIGQFESSFSYTGQARQL
jgi:hypothetical protein